MKSILISTILMFSFVFTYAQDGEPADTTSTTNESGGYSLGSPTTDSTKTTVEFKVGSSNPDKNKNLTTRWITFGLGVNPVMADGSFDLPSDPNFYDDWGLRNGKSTNVDLGIVQQKLNLIKHKLNLYTGLGLDINKFMFEDDFIIDREANTWQTTPFSAETKKNRLTTTFLHIPVMLNFESSTNHYESFRLNLGGFAGLRLSSNQKIKFEDKDDNFIDGKKKYKEHDSFNQNGFAYGLKGELGYGPVNLYAKYHLNDIFEDESAPELNTFSIGLMIVPF